MLTKTLIMRNDKIERKSESQLEMRPKLMQHDEKCNPTKVDAVDVALQSFDGWHGELDTKLRNKHGSSHGSCGIALASDNANKLAMTNNLLSSTSDKNTIEQEQLKSLNDCSFPITHSSDENKDALLLLKPGFCVSCLIGYEGRGSLSS